MNTLKKSIRFDVWIPVLSAMALPARAATLEVDINDPGCSDATGTPFCHIQAAVDAARR